jgi:hypothetical protein
MTKADMDKIVFFLLSKYSNLYKDRYDKQPIVNKHKEKWGMKSLVEDFGSDQVEKVLDFYINKTSKEGHPINYFYNNFDSLLLSLNSIEKDRRERSLRRSQMEKIRQEYLNGYA